MLESMALGAVAVVPYRVDLARGRVELPAGRLVLHAESKGLEGKLDFAGHGDALSCHVAECQLQRAFFNCFGLADPLLMCHHLLLVFALAL